MTCWMIGRHWLTCCISLLRIAQNHKKGGGATVGHGCVFTRAAGEGRTNGKLDVCAESDAQDRNGKRQKSVLRDRSVFSTCLVVEASITNLRACNNNNQQKNQKIRLEQVRHVRNER